VSRRKDDGDDESVDAPPRRSSFLGPAWDIRVIEAAVAADEADVVPAGETAESDGA